MKKAVFFDIDGTLVSFQTHQVSAMTFETLRKLKENGYLLFIATGRGKDGLKCLEDFPFDGYITLNGQYCYTGTGEVIYENFIRKEELAVLLDYLKEHPFPCGFTMENTKVFNYRDQRVDDVHAITQNDDHPAGDVSNVINEKIYQAMAFINEAEEKELMKELKNCTSARWYPTFTDISPIGGTKVKGIDQFCAYYGVELQDTYAFGDGGNDREMLEHVHTSIVMGSADDSIKGIADYVTDDVDHEGITKACIRLGMI
ncbi:MAG: Cof-type HAD-IIB family hydrolase [Solobacterium sp.]|nr:Cof-type HAD-IIB family hydrolase [Solobacterium sp.]